MLGLMVWCSANKRILCRNELLLSDAQWQTINLLMQIVF